MAIASNAQRRTQLAMQLLYGLASPKDISHEHIGTGAQFFLFTFAAHTNDLSASGLFKSDCCSGKCADVDT